MLSAFHARPILELKQGDKSKIESVLAYGDKLLVGLSTGSLRIYRVNESIPQTNGQSHAIDASQASEGDNKARLIDLIADKEHFSRKPVQQLAIIKEANILISLSDGYVCLNDLQTYNLIERLEKTKGSTSFAVISNIAKDAVTGIPTIVSRLAVAVKRKILIWTWQDMEVSDTTVELTLAAPVKSLTWANGTKLVVGMDPGYIIADIESRAMLDINKPAAAGEVSGAAGVRFAAVNSSGMGYVGMGNWVPRPLATKISEGQMLLAKDVNTLFIDLDGKAIDKRQIPWPTSPEAIGYSYPYMLALLPPSQGRLEIRNPETLSLLQSIPLPNATYLHVPQPYISLAHAGKGFLVASDRCIWRMGALGYDSQINELVERSRFDEAISLVSLLEDTLLVDKEERLRDIKMHKAQSLFEQRKYRDALDLFSSVSAPPQRVIALYPESIAGGLSTFEAKRSSGEDELRRDQPSEQKPGVKIPPSVQSLRGKRPVVKHRDSDIASIKAGITGDVANVSKEKSDGRLEGRDFTLAVNELCAFLVQTRTQIQKFINYDGSLKEPLISGDYGDKPPFEHLLVQNSESVPVNWQKKLYEAAMLVDTTLFRAYMLARPSLAGPLFRLDNFCSPEVVNEKLYESGRYSDLIDFLYGKKLHKQALELLEKFGKNEAGDEVDEVLRGPRRTVAYLQQLPFELIDVILQYARWPVTTNPDLGMQVFLVDTENAETLPRPRVLGFLESIDSNLAVRYLEHVIEELNDQTPEFHERLIDLYLDRLKAAPATEQTEPDQQSTQQKLESFLQNSPQYHKLRILSRLPTSDPKFYESRATVLSKLSVHARALQIYVFQLKDYQKAEEYCNRIYFSTLPNTASTAAVSTTLDPDDPCQPQPIYTTLLSLYLSPPPSLPTNLPAALALLSHHGSRLPALSTLALLPTALPVQELEEYFQARMRAAQSLAREEAVVAALCGLEKVGWEGALLVGGEGGGGYGGGAEGGAGYRGGDGIKAVGKGRSRRVVLGEDRLCPVCHKRFGRAAVRVWPDGEVLHYGCVDRRREDGVDGRVGG